MKNKGIAIFSMGLGAVSVFFSFLPELWWVSLVCAISGLILGITLKTKIKKSNGKVNGNGMGNAGIVLSIITLGFNLIAFVTGRLFLGVISSALS